jgi:predicted RND superfamily exporter protein
VSNLHRRQWFPRFLVRVSVRHPRRTLFCWIIALTAVSAGLFQLKIDTTTDSVLNTGTDGWSFYQHSQDLFGGDQIVVVALPGDRAFDGALLSEIYQLTQEFEKLDGVRRVDSVSTVPVVQGGPDGSLNLEPALTLPVDSREVARRLHNDRIAPRSLISDDGRVGAINVLIDRDYADYAGIVGATRAAVGDREAWISGVPVFRSTASARTRKEILLFVPITVAAIALLMTFAYRSARMTVIALAVGAAGSWIVVSMMGFAGAPLSLVTMLLPSVMLALGCAYSIHMLSAARAGGTDLEARLGQVALPVALSSLTTSIGFSAIGTIQIEEVRYVGGFGALGAASLGFAALTLAPALLKLWDAPSASPRESMVEKYVRDKIIRIAVEYRGRVLAGWVIVLAFLCVGILRIDVVTDPTQWFPRGSEVRDSYDAIGAKLSGISPVNIVIQSQSGDSVIDALPLAAIDELTEYLESLTYVGKATSIRDPLRQIHGGFLNDSSAPLPLAPNLAEQYLLLLESVDQIGDLVTGDRQAANVLLRVNDNGSEALLEIERLASEWWSKNGTAGFTQRTTGIMYEFARAEDEIAYGQLRGLLLALGVIGLIMLGALGNLQMALLSMVPNIVPTVMVFGFMGWLGIPLDAGTVVIGSLALGIAVDDTIHLVNGFHERIEAGAESPVALNDAISHILHPVVLTTASIGLGFGLIGFSGFVLTRNVGLLLSGVTVVCLIADLVLLPALLMTLQRSKSAS